MVASSTITTTTATTTLRPGKGKKEEVNLQHLIREFVFSDRI